MSFTSMRKKSKSNFASLQKKLVDSTSTSKNTYNNVDERFWAFEPDETGNAQVTLRFLPLWEAADETKLAPVIRVWSHGFKVDGKWYIDECRNTINGKVIPGACPVCDHNYKFANDLGGWNSMSEAQRSEIRAGSKGNQGGRGKGTRYIANVYIVNDKANPENNGKVMLWKFGPQIKKIIDNAIVPEFDDETPVDPFDLWEGAHFRLRVRKVEGQTNYQKSDFDKPSQLLADEDEMETIWNSQHDLTEFVDPSKFKSLVEQTKRFNMVMGIGAVEPVMQAPVVETVVEPEPVVAKESKPEPVADDDSDIDFFADLLDD